MRGIILREQQVCLIILREGWDRNEKGAPSDRGAPCILHCVYLWAGAAGAVAVGAVAVVDVGAVAVGADCSAGFGAGCFSHAATAKTMVTAAAAMITEIFFMSFHLPSSRDINNSAPP
jgi:hypothetical protein